jgi:hypothetical protein
MRTLRSRIVPLLKSFARDSIYSRLASRFAITPDTNSSTETWSLAAISAARLYKSSGAAILLLISPLFLSSAKTRAVSSPGCQTAPRRQNALTLCVTMAFARPATASSRRNSSPGVGEKRPEPEVNVYFAARETEGSDDSFDSGSQEFRRSASRLLTASSIRSTKIKGTQPLPIRRKNHVRS